MKFDICLMNPPYAGTLHLDFLEKGLDTLSVDGKIVIVEPATWLINVRKTGKAKRYDKIKERICGHVRSVMIENLNKEFDIVLYVPLSITNIDQSKEYKEIDCDICGERHKVSSLYDANLIGNYDLIWSIISKVQSYDNMMDEHITNEDKGKGYWYAKCANIGRGGCSSGDKFHLDSFYYGNVFKYFYFNGYDNRDMINNHPLKLKSPGNKDTDKNASCVYGSKDEVENWAYFNMNNKLPLFINLCLTINQNNNSKKYLPWLVDKQYTDDEINSLFKFTDDEINLINYTVEKFERNSPWFKRYMCGASSVSDEEVQKYIDKLKEKHNIR